MAWGRPLAGGQRTVAGLSSIARRSAAAFGDDCNGKYCGRCSLHLVESTLKGQDLMKALQKLLLNRAAVVSMIFLSLWVFLALAAPLLPLHSPIEVFDGQQLIPP